MTEAEPVVRVAAGAVRGRLESGVAVFKGIPFAELPVRFGAPAPVEGWEGTRDAQSYGPPPPQSAMFGTDALAAAPDGWLTVNVWTSDPAANLPVMVWIQGGGYMLGMSGLPEYDGGRLARDGVVLVTFNYRVGIEGFALIDGAPANRGLLDQVAALEWLRDNVSAFGGDPDQVTIFGQSAGGGSVAALLAMPSAAGLFRRAVVQSMPGVFLTPELATDIAGVFAAELGLQPAELASVAPDALPAVADAVLATIGQRADRWGLAAHRRVPLGPVVDGATLPTDPWAALAGGAARDVDLLVGHVRHEQRLFDLIEGTLGQISEEQAAAALSLFAPGPDGEAQYRAAGGGPNELYDQVHSDWLFRMPSLHLAEAHTGRVHVYELTWPAPGLGGALGACHGLDVPLVFGNLTSGQTAMLLGDDLTEAEVVSAQLRGSWTRFANDGDPGWPAYDREQRLTRVFVTEPSVVAYPEETSRQIWQDHVFSALPLLSRG
ncbi:carboxylesterase/lipase family protein [Angustibacter sp. McL0619]|uniref:carboxylesterase/lipase family protein n=1 Tax=Angustibacter sp. McL0619 TaxID=3415676 RepID=UPI003CF04DC3